MVIGYLIGRFRLMEQNKSNYDNAKTKIRNQIMHIYRILQIGAIKTILEQAPDILPIACGGGGIPVSRVPSNPTTLAGVEAVIDKDACGAKLAVELEADGFIILTDGGGIWQNFGKPNAREMKKASPGELIDRW